jgi:uncharacterized membrane protein
MRILTKISYLFGVLAVVAALIFHRQAATGVWVGIPYRMDIVYYPDTRFDLFAVGFAVFGVTCLIYGTVLTFMHDDDKYQDMKAYDRLRAINGWK